jgi:glycosyltransferase involved in cell wall biosynthesis
MGAVWVSTHEVDPGISAVGVCVPVHNEEESLPRALAALDEAFRQLAIRAVDCRLAIVLDDCSDGSEAIAREWARSAPQVTTLVLECSAHNVGVARQTGCLGLLETVGAFDTSRVWLATTDADSEVPPHWLTHQMDCKKGNIDFWAGRVEVTDWSGRASTTSAVWNDRYDGEHAPIHGANMGIDASLFLQVGGFPPLPSGEDGALRNAVARTGSTICHDRLVTVKTSARTRARAPLGFASYLDSIEYRLWD